MLELYHWEPNGACARVMITLKEKGLEFRSRYLDLFALEQHSPAFTALNPSGETPVLVRDGEAYNESSYICEYLDEAFPERPLMPEDPYGRWRVRGWQKYVDDYLAAAVGDLAWAAYGKAALEGRKLEPDQILDRVPTRERRDVWAEALQGYDETRLDKARSRVRLAVVKIEADLEGSDWIAGEAFSLADIAAFAYAAYLPRLAPELLNAEVAPRATAWLRRVSERPGVKAALAMARTPDPFTAAAPGPEHVRWG
jgi:glutathione S-transferase